MSAIYDPEKDAPHPGLQPQALQRIVGEAVLELLTDGPVGQMKARERGAALESGDLAQIIGEVAIQAIGNPALEKLTPGEPFFVLRARDRCAPGAVASWVYLATLAGCPAEKTEDAVRRQLEMINWPVKKFPD